MSLDSLITRSRARLATQFDDTIVFTRVAGTPTFNTTTGQYDTTTTTVYDGACKIRPEARQGNDIEAGDTTVRRVDYRITLPADTPVKVGDEGTCTASLRDVGLVGRRFRVTDVLADSWQVGRVAICEHFEDET